MTETNQTQGKDPETGRFAAGNRWWETRSSAGPKPKFKSADDLWAACVEYFDWVEENPLHAGHVVSFQGVGNIVAVPKMRAMTIMGLCLFLDIEERTWRGWKQADGDMFRADLLPVIERAETIIRKQKFEGAAADLLNANIIARDLGLADKKEVTGADGEALIPAVNDVELARRVAFVLQQGIQKGSSNGESG